VSSESVTSGTLTFLFTDLADSTYLWEQREAEMAEAVARHDGLLGEVVARHAGKVVKFQGDGLMAVFDDADAAVRAAVEGQRELGRRSFPVPLGVRMGLCTGATRVREGDYHGQVVNRAARTAAAAHPGQILVTPTTAALLGSFGLRDLGEHRLKGLPPMRLSQVLAEGIEVEFPPLAVPSIALGVAPTTAFVGRSQELTAVQQLLSDHAVVTLTGVGGSGKTRLAIEVGRLLSEQYPDGVWFTDLAVVTDPDGVADAVARSLGLVDSGQLEDQLARIASHVASRTMLCILDNCEHLLDGCAELAEVVIARPTATRVLATSREPLGVPGEQVYLVPSLDARTDATALFMARACEVRPQFVLDGAATETVAKICERLDGIPLAIELAAARVNQLAPAQLLDRLADRFHLLTGGRRRVQRQQTLAATLDWSHDLLDVHERSLLRRLAVFPGSFSLEAAEAVSGVSDVATLGSLVTKSLVTVVDAGEQFRYRLLETVRLYAEEKLAAAGESDAVRQRHARWVRDALDAVPLESRWFGDDPGPVDLNDVNAALEWSSAAGSPSLVARLASGVSWTRFEHWRDGLRWCESVVDADALHPRERLQVLILLVQLSGFNSSTRTREFGERAEELVGGLVDPMVALMWVLRGTDATIAEATQDAALADVISEKLELGVSIAAAFSLPWQVCCRVLAAFSYTTMGRSSDAERHLEEAVTRAEHLEGYDGLRNAARACLSLHRVVAGDIDRARALTEGLVEPPQSAMFSREGAMVAVVATAAGGDGPAARQELAASYQRALRTGQPYGVEQILVFASGVAGVEGDWETAARLLAASNKGYRRSPFSYLTYRTFRDRAREALGVDRFRELRDEGRRLTPDEAMALLTQCDAS
jgi:predicted ATPase/class 3 adenylate cyclase